jgi:predicted GTPase
MWKQRGSKRLMPMGIDGGADGMAAGRVRTLILGAAGRDFHDFNVLYRDDPATEVVAFTAAQIPGISGRRYPASLAGPLYPAGIPIVPEDSLEEICRGERITRVVFAYSDVSHVAVMHLASRALAAGADFVLPGPARTMLRSRLPVIAVTAVRTGCGKSQVARYLSRRLRESGWRVAVLRHPMPYGDLERQRVQRFATLADLAAAHCTVEEREEYEPHIAAGNVVFAGVDYAAILAVAEAAADVIMWDGGNNDFAFIRPDLSIVLVDALRPEQLATHHPGEAALRLADAVLIAKSNAAAPAGVAAIVREVGLLNPRARILRGRSVVAADAPERLRGRRVVVVEDGPTITHGGMPHGAGYALCREIGASIVDPRPAAAGDIADAYRAYPHIGAVLPALGYGPAQLENLRLTLDKVDAEIIAIATPIDLAAVIPLSKPSVRIRYDFAEADAPGLGGLVGEFMAGQASRGVDTPGDSRR